MRGPTSIVLLAAAAAGASALVTTGDAAAQVRAEPPQEVAAPPQAIACDACVHGEQELDALGPAGNALRVYADPMIAEWVPLGIEDDVVDARQEAHLREHLDTRIDLHEAIRELRRHSDEQMLAIAFALCRSADQDCARYLAGALRRVRHIEPGYIPGPDHMPYGLPHDDHPGTCDPYVATTKSPRYGLGFEYASGWQRSARPVDGRAWSLGVEARARLRDRIGMVARVDRSTGRDEALDGNGDGRDDVSTGAVTRWTALAGPTLRVHTVRVPRAPRYWQVDSLVGLLLSGDQSGPLVGLDISYQLVVARLGLRTVQGFFDAREESSVLLHAGFMFGAGPQFYSGAGCGIERTPRGSAWAIALDVPVGGYAAGVGPITPGIGLEGALHLHHRVDGIVRADLLDMPSGDKDRSLHSSVLVGGRIDVSRKSVGTRTGFFSTLAVGYAHVATTSSADVRSGPVGDVSFAWGGQGSDGAAWVRLHGRFGLSPDNADLRAVFLSLGAELRLDRERWKDRN